MSDWTSDLSFAHRLADLADAITLPAFRSVAVRRKADGSEVTDADEEAERVLRGAIESQFPDDGILGEEHGRKTGSSGRRWIVDPIDGTRNYSWGIPVWGTILALEADGEIVVGLCSAPALGERYDAARGAGARRNGGPIRVSQTAALTDARVGHADLVSFAKHGRADGLERLARAAGATRGFGDFWGHMLVAAGALDVMVEPVVNPWDVAPLLVIVEEAGGKLTDLDGNRRYDGGSVVSSNAVLHDAVLEQLRGLPG